MAEIVAEFFQVIGVAEIAPATMAELIPYVLTVFIGLVLVLAVFRVIGGIVEAVMYSVRRY